MNNFREALEKKLVRSRYNNFGSDNYDEYRFGEYPKEIEVRPGTFIKIKRVIKKIIGYKKRQFLNVYKEFLNKIRRWVTKNL